MAQFMTRVQLNGRPTAEQYEKLHKAMKSRGFTRVISSDEPKWYWLPHGEYYREDNSTRQQVLADAKAAATSVTNDSETIVTEAKAFTWSNLKPATQADTVAA